jgi:predicted HAD superfamily Cof-like phosphohydrolase
MQSSTSAEQGTKTIRLKTLTKLSTTLPTSVTNYENSAKHFRKAYRLPTNLTPGSLNLQQTLIAEEYAELNEAFCELRKDISNKQAREHMLKELTDLLYVIHQMAAAFDWDICSAFNRVHASNMSKLDENGEPIYREDGKILKGHNYFLPQLIDLV